MYRHIAVCVDADRGSPAAIREGRRLRGMWPGRLSLVHVASPPLAGYSRWERPTDQEFVQEARIRLERIARDVPGAEPVTLWGRPAHRVVEWAAEAGCDLLVAASHGGALARAGLGGFSRHIAYHAPCAVLLVPPPVPEG